MGDTAGEQDASRSTELSCGCPLAKLAPFSRPQLPQLPSPAKPGPGPSWLQFCRLELSSGPRLE